MFCPPCNVCFEHCNFIIWVPSWEIFHFSCTFFLENLSQTVETNSFFFLPGVTLLLLSVCFGHWASTNTWLWKQTLPHDLCSESMLLKLDRNTIFFLLFQNLSNFLQTNTLCANVFSYLCFLFASCRTKESFAARSFICSDTAAFREDVKEGCFERKAATKEKI